MVISESECIEALQDAAERIGKSPTKKEYEDLGIRPSSGSIKRIMGGWNLAKKRAGLQTYSQSPGGGSPIEPKPDWVQLPPGYSWEEMTPQQRWYYKNREYRISVKSKRLKEIKDWYFDLKAVYACSECSESHPSCLVFHHDGDKNSEISYMVAQGFSKDRILKEINNCVPLCANCHHRKHISEVPGGWDIGIADQNLMEAPETIFEVFPSKEDLFKYEYRARLRSWLHYYKRTVGCERCSEKDPACLEFHHRDPDQKRMRIASLVVYNPCKEDIMEEIDLCEVICRNCHRKEHLS